jgi:Na+/H+ antiporter NhaD/arsenite permease-like protein
MFKMKDFILEEWLFVISGIILICTSVYVKNIPIYSLAEIEVVFILLILFIVINGLDQSKLILKIAQKFENAKATALSLITSSFLLSMLVTNDIALMVLVPLTLSLNIKNKDIVIILEVLASNSGSALTPIGNPQNLFIYWFYNLDIYTFIKTIAPFSFILFFFIIIFSLLIDTKTTTHNQYTKKVTKKAYIYAILLLIIILIVLHILNIYFGILILLYTYFFDKKALKIDYFLILSFLFFFGIANNLKLIISPEVLHTQHLFISSVLISQLISNVPTTLLFAKFTSNYQDLLWGVNAGGFGTLFGSLANLIAYKIYISNKHTKNHWQFTLRFFILNFVALFISIFLYFLLRH